MTTNEAKHKLALHIITHLANQKTRAHKDGNCLYRTEDDLRCAAGCTIPDGAYTAGMEGNSVPDILEKSEAYRNHLLEEFGLHPEEALPILQGLQNIHDTRRVEDWPVAIYGFMLGYFDSIYHANSADRTFYNAGWKLEANNV